jgi:regulator of sigma E protease
LADIDGQSYPSDKSGLLTGDRIITVNGKPINNYRDMQENIALNPEKNLSLTVLRDGANINLTIRPTLHKSGAGKIGVYPWTDPEVQAIQPDSPAEKAGLKPGDRILGIQQHALSGDEFKELPFTVAFLRIFKETQSEETQPQDFSLVFERNGMTQTAEMRNIAIVGGFPDLGIQYPSIHFKTPSLSLPAALAVGSKEAARTFAISLKSLGLLFNKNIDLTQAVSGPARITYMLGDVATGGFKESAAMGLVTALNFLALISIALCLMNLLPLPIIDGGMIILYLVEMIKRGPIHPKVVSVFQAAGMVIIFGLMVFAAFSDFLFFVGK